MSILLLILLIIFGLCWGSFLNVVIARGLTGESIIYPFSKCPKCSHRLFWWHNIPLLSYVILKGKCFFCNKSISIRYPIIELVGLFIVLFSFWKYVSVFDALSVILILSMFLTISLSDVEIKKISVIQACLIIIGGLIFNRYDIFNSISGALIGGGLISSLIFAGRVVLNKETFGIGDVFLFMGLGSVVGFDKLFLFIIYSIIIQFFIVLPKYITSLIRSENAETLKYLIIFTITCLFLYVSRNIFNMVSNAVITIFLGILLFSAIKLIQNLITNIKSSENPSYCPFAPAIALVCLYFLC